MGAHHGANTTPTEHQRAFLLISYMPWTQRKTLIQGALGSGLVQSVIFPSWPHSHFLLPLSKDFFFFS